ncbi:MAG: hypothetical protein ACTSO7_08875 [Candidatus Heimdallarchaeota archaeon]
MSKKLGKNKQLVYSSNKPGRGVRFSIYSNGEVIIEGKGSQYGINVPAKLREWIAPKKNEEEQSYELSMTLEVSNGQERCTLKDHSTQLVIKQKKWLLKPEDVQCFGSSLQELLTVRVSVRCSFILPKKLWSEQFKEAIQIINSYSNNKDSDFSVIVFGGKGNGSYEVLQDSKGQILVKFTGSIKEGAIQLPAELEKIFEGWATSTEQLHCVYDNEEQIIGYTILINSKSRPERVRKTLHIPYTGPPKQVELTLYKPSFKLSKQMESDLIIKEQLVTAGCNISSLISNVKPGGVHRNESLEQRYQQLLLKAFDDQKGIYAQPEVRITTTKNQPIIPLKNSYTFDFMVYQPAKSKDDQSLTLLCEFKTSLGKGKAVIITEAIANMRHIHQQVSERLTVPILFLSEELMDGKDVITGINSNYCGVLLIGPKDLATFEGNPSLFLICLQQFQVNQNILYNQGNCTTHPFTKQIISRSELENEAEMMLIMRNDSVPISYDLKRKYCSLMGIRLHDFNVLFKYFQKAQLDNINAKNIDTKAKKKVQQSNSSLKKVHQLLCGKKSVAMIEVLNTLEKNNCFQKLLDQENLLLSTFPSDVLVLGQKSTNRLGATFEEEMQLILEKNGYAIVTNLWCYYRRRKFEIDLIGLKENKISIFSCKDMSTTSNWGQIITSTKEAANKLKYRKEQINAHQAKLYIKPNLKFKSKLHQKKELEKWSTNIEIVFQT